MSAADHNLTAHCQPSTSCRDSGNDTTSTTVAAVLPDDSSVSFEQILIVIVYTLIVVVGIFGNFLVIFVVIKAKRYRRSTIHVFILHLAFADLAFLAVCMPAHTTVFLRPWPFGDLVCRAVHLLQFITMYVSVTFLILMSADRYLAIATPLRTKRIRTPRNAQFIAIVVWLLACIVSIPWPIVYGVKTYNHDFNGNIMPSMTFCSFYIASRQWKLVLFLFTSIAGYALPCVLIGSFSFGMLYKLWTFRCPDVNASSRAAALAVKKRVAFIVSVIVTTFLLCWLPYHCVVLWAVLAPDSYMKSPWAYPIHATAHALSYANSCMNPIIYNLFSNHFRRGFYGVFETFFVTRLVCFCFVNRRHAVQLNEMALLDFRPTFSLRRLQHQEQPAICEGRR